MLSFETDNAHFRSIRVFVVEPDGACRIFQFSRRPLGEPWPEQTRFFFKNSDMAGSESFNTGSREVPPVSGKGIELPWYCLLRQKRSRTDPNRLSQMTVFLSKLGLGNSRGHRFSRLHRLERRLRSNGTPSTSGIRLFDRPYFRYCDLRQKRAVLSFETDGVVADFDTVPE
jgi:hypothetical protein